MKGRNQRGITLIALVVTIIVLLILAGITINLAFNSNGILNRAGQAKESLRQAQIKELIDLWKFDNEIGNKTSTDVKPLSQVIKDLKDAKLITPEEEEQLKNEGTITIGKETIVVSKYLFDDVKKVNRPQLTDGMIPIKYDTSKTNWVICDEKDAEWYDYKTKNYANIMLSDGTYKDKKQVGQEVTDEQLGSMFVWIPRYSYTIQDKMTYVPKSGEGTQQDITDVSFLQGISNTDETDSLTQKRVHPAFKFGEKDLPGIWVAKFEASMVETNNNLESENNVATGKTVKVVPNALTWRYINVGNCFKNCLNIKNNDIYGLKNTSADTHLMKNIEWGAAAYLAASQYGITPTINSKRENLGSGKYNEWAAEGDYKTNVTQSTTGNITGIYDMNGGAWEYVAAYYDNGARDLSYYGSNEIFGGNTLNNQYTKYWDRYDVSNEEKEASKPVEGHLNGTLWDEPKESNSKRKRITDARYNLMSNKYGDAMYEVIRPNEYSYFGKRQDGRYDWIKDDCPSSTQYGNTAYNNDFALIGNCAPSFLVRGGVWWDDTRAGVFASDSNYGGSALLTVVFRPVLVVE